MKNKAKSIYLLMFCYIFFSFVVFIPDGDINVYGWIKVLFVSLAINLIYLTIVSYDNLKESAVIFIKLYLINVLSKQIYKIYRYIKIYHSSKSGYEILIITGIILFIFVAHLNVDLKRFAIPFFVITVTLITMIVILNMSKISRYNICSHKEKGIYIDFSSITMFDYSVPLIVLSNTDSMKYKFRRIKSVLISYICLFLIVLMSFSCFYGGYMYSISPLQCLFQISGANLIRNYDALFTFFIIFGFFASIIVILLSIKELNMGEGCKIKECKYGFLFLVIVFFFLDVKINPYISIVVELLAIITLILGKKNENI